MPGLALIALLVILSFILPFTVLSTVDAWWGSFLFWSAATLVVIVISAALSSRWKD